MVTITNLGMGYGGQMLFADACEQFHPGNRYGIVGANGAGKSTLLRLITREEFPTEGDVIIPKKVRIGSLEQDHFQYEDIAIRDVVMMGNKEVWDAMVEKDAMLEGPEDAFDVDRYGDLEDTILRLDGYSLESTAADILEGMQIPTERHLDPLSSLSGGFKLRVLLARVLAGQPDLLLLDEPNNHLDIVSLRWLEKFLVEFKGCAIVVSHDHRFLDNICTHIVDVDYQRVTIYKGNYQAFLDGKAEIRDRLEREIDKRQKEIAEHKAFIQRFKAKASKARQANSRQKRMEKISIEELPTSSRQHPNFKFPQQRASGRTVLTAKDIGKSYEDKKVLENVGLTVNRGDRVAILGPNGIGKSTLLKVLMEKVQPDEGEFEWGYETHIGYFAQDHHDVMSGEHTVTSWLWDKAPGDPQGAIYGRLAQVLFSRDDADKRIDTLSGGEAARLALAGIAAKEPNVLVLDEPTNHLDLEGIESLAGSLKTFEGTLVFVSHDRWFVGQVANRIIEITPEGMNDFKGTFAEYLRYCGTDHLDVAAVMEASKEVKRKGQ